MPSTTKAAENFHLKVSVVSFFARYPELDRVADRLSESGIATMSDLVTYSEADLLKKLHVTDAQKAQFREALKQGFLNLKP